MSKGLLDRFGEKRVIDTPITESGFAGLAVGAALAGLHPICEVRRSFGDGSILTIDAVHDGQLLPPGTFTLYITERLLIEPKAIDQVINSGAQTHYMSGGIQPCNITFRGPNGFASGVAAQHSQDFTAWYGSIPGLKVVSPWSAEDAKGLLKAAIRDNNPVLYLEHKLLYRLPELREELPEEDYIVPIGQAITRRPGDHLTILTYGAMVHTCLKAAQTLSQEDHIEAEVVDLRSLVPLDREAIMRSVKCTNKTLIVYEDTLTGGIGAELSAILAEDLFEYLDGPIMRVAAPDTAFPYAPELEAAFLPNTVKILAAARKLAAY